MNHRICSTPEEEMPAYRDKTVVVTGGAGFIGSHLVEALVDAGAKVRVVDNLSAGRKDNLGAVMHKVEFLELDITRADAAARAVRGAELVFHLAANASVPRSVEDPVHDFTSNAVGTVQILSALRTEAVGKCVVASSGAVYGQPTTFPIREEHALAPISPYGAGKASAEALARAFSASYGVPATIARLFNTYGPRQPRFVMYDFYRKLRADPTQLEILGDGSQVRDFCFVADTVNALLKIGHLDHTACDAFNISSGQSHTVVQIAQTMCEVMGLKHVTLCFTGQSWPGDAQRWEVSIDKLKTVTGYRPAHDLHSGLAALVAWFDKHAERFETVTDR